MKTITTTLAVCAVCLLGACKPATQATTPAVAPAAAQPAAPSALLGKWSGPEGTFLLLEKKEAAYAVTVGNLDGPRTFPAQQEGNTVTFVRDGKSFTLAPTDGAGTGMKWLAGRQHCIVVAPGEGYCRD